MIKLENGVYHAEIIDVSGEDYGKYMKVIIAVDIILSETQTKRIIYFGDKDYTRKYFNQVGLTSETAVGKIVKVTIWDKKYRKKDGTEIIRKEIRYLYFLDENDNPILPEGYVQLDF